MKYVKMLGLAAVAAAALMAFVGAGTASALPVVCSTTVDPCPAAQMWPNGTTVDFSTEAAGKATLEDAFGFIKNECESTVAGKLTNNTTGAPTLSGLTLTWANCTRTTTNVTVGTLKIETITGSSNGTVKVDTEFEVTTNVPTLSGGEVSCVYQAPANLSLGTLTEGNPPTMDVSTTVNPTPGQPSECPSNAKWTGKYVLTSPSGTTGSLSHN